MYLLETQGTKLRRLCCVPCVAQNKSKLRDLFELCFGSVCGPSLMYACAYFQAKFYTQTYRVVQRHTFFACFVFVLSMSISWSNIGDQNFPHITHSRCLSGTIFTYVGVCMCHRHTIESCIASNDNNNDKICLLLHIIQPLYTVRVHTTLSVFYGQETQFPGREFSLFASYTDHLHFFPLTFPRVKHLPLCNTYTCKSHLSMFAQENVVSSSFLLLYVGKINANEQRNDQV